MTGIAELDADLDRSLGCFEVWIDVCDLAA